MWWVLIFFPVILGFRTFGKPGSLPLSSQVLNSTVKCHSSRVFLDLDHNSYHLYYSWYNGRTCGASPSFVLDLWPNLSPNTAFWISLDMNKIVNISIILYLLKYSVTEWSMHCIIHWHTWSLVSVFVWMTWVCWVWGSCFKFLSKSFKIAVPEKWKICVIIQIVLRKKSCPLWQLRNQLRNISYFFSCALTCVFICLRNSCKSVSSQVNFCFQSFLFINCIKHTLKGKQVKQVWHTWSGWGDRRPVKEQIFAFSSGKKALQWRKYFKYLNIKLTKHDGILCRV